MSVPSASDVRKPEFGATRRHFIFNDHHDRLRESIGAFVERELAPHAEEWEETTFPDWVFTWMGELGFLGLSYPEAYGGQGGDSFCNLVLAEELTRSDSGGLAMGVAVHTDMATPPIHLFGTEQQKRDYLVPSIQGTKIASLGITEPDAGSDVRAIKTRAVRRRRRVRHQRLEDLHHQRAPLELHRAGHQDRPGRGLRRLHAVPGRHGPARRRARAAPAQARHGRIRHGAARLPGRPRAGDRGARAGRPRASTTSCGSCRASG